METHTPPTTNHSARETLAQLSHDRSVLAGRVAAPTWHWPLLGLIVALFIASPAIGNDAIGDTIFIGCVVAAIIVSGRYAKEVGAKGLRSGIHGVVLGAIFLAGALILYSVSLGLVASDHPLWVVLPALGSFMLVIWLGRLFTGVLEERLTSDH